jgi:hypothetical protein
LSKTIRIRKSKKKKTNAYDTFAIHSDPGTQQATRH